MAKKFKFNHDTLDFVEVRNSVLNIARNLLLWLFVAALFLAGYYALFSQFFSTPQEKQLADLNRTLDDNHEQLTVQHRLLQRELGELRQRDANIYRLLFEADPPDALEGNGSISSSSIEHGNNTELTMQTKAGIDRLKILVDKQTFLLQKIIAAAENATNVQNLPTIQPVRNSDLRRTAATFGMRMHPFYKVLKMHHGMDFTAPQGDNVFATGNAVVESVDNHPRSTGLTITLNHGNGYKTVYAYLFKANVTKGARVKRGQVIGLVGNSGRSLVTHLHYEVLKNGRAVNPLHYFFQELTPEDYEQMISIAKNKGQSMD
ncbi:MAG: M23 family metallopeptidase [Prevotellaceae bacterium]|nr:M23 family metallopeptidase [Prevotellaceae bacterium]